MSKCTFCDGRVVPFEGEEGKPAGSACAKCDRLYELSGCPVLTSEELRLLPYGERLLVLVLRFKHVAEHPLVLCDLGDLCKQTDALMAEIART